MSRAQPASDYVSRSNTGMKNRIINGGMDISQRGTSFTAVANGVYTLDRWSYPQSNDASITITQNSDVPSNNEFQNSLRVTVNTADASIASGQYGFLQQVIEGYNIRDLIGRTFTVSFWVRSTKTGIHCAAVKNSSLDRCYVAEYTINTTNTWEYKSFTVSGGLPAAGTWNYTNGAGLLVNFTLAGGTTYQGSIGWNTISMIATSNQVNCLDSTSNIFAITGVQLEVGAIATPFEHRPYGTELALCQRYCPVIEATDYSVVGGASSATNAICAVYFSSKARVGPTTITVGSLSGKGFAHFGGGGIAISAVNIIAGTTDLVRLDVTTAGGLTPGSGGVVALPKIIFNGCEL